MKKFLFTVAALCLLSAASHAQVSFGLKAGTNFSSVSLDTKEPLKSAGTVGGFHVGFATRLELPVLPIFVQGEVLYSRLGGSMEVNEGVEGFNYAAFKEADFNIQRLDIPIMVGPKFAVGPIGVRAQVGPVASLMLQNGLKDVYTKYQEARAEGQSVSEVATKGFSWGYQAGVGVDVWKLSADIKYEGGLSDVAAATGQSGLANFDARTNQWIFSLGYFF
jgi:hypothetical protein